MSKAAALVASSLRHPASSLLLPLIVGLGLLVPAAAGASSTGMPGGLQGAVSRAIGADTRSFWIDAGTARNPVQRFAVHVSRRGARIVVAAGTASLRLRAVGRGRTVVPVAASRQVVNRNMVRIGHGAVAEWLVNGPLGLEQGFAVVRRPSGPAGAPLTLALGGEGTLAPALHGGVVSFGSSDLRYGQLSAVDARGRALRSWLAVRGGLVLIRVDDRGARYPVRIDPLVQESAKFTEPGGATAGDRFGLSVAAQGDTVVVGAPGAGAGKVYVFERPPGGWSSGLAPLAVFAGIASKGQFGESVAISATGQTIAVGEPAGGLYNGGPVQGGDAWVYRRPATGWTTGMAGQNINPVVGGEFPLGAPRWGATVAVAPDDSFVAVGAPSFSGNQLFNPLAGQVGVVMISQIREGAVATGGTYLGASIVGSASPHVVGPGLAISGHTVFIGAPDSTVATNDTNFDPATSGPLATSGAVFAYTEPAGGWGSGGFLRGADAALVAPAQIDNAGLGTSVAASGSSVLAGAPAPSTNTTHPHGTAYIFERPPGGWVGRVYPTATLLPSDSAADDRFGSAVALSPTMAAVGADASERLPPSGKGAVYAFDRPTGGWSAAATPQAESVKLTASDGQVGDELGGGDNNLETFIPLDPAHNGAQVAISGPTVFGAAPDAGSGAGALYAFSVQRRLTVTLTGLGDGAVTAPGLACTLSQCTIDRSVGTPVTLTAIPSADSTFTGWSGGGCSGTDTCQVILAADTAVSATFAPQPRLSVLVLGAGSVGGPGINCPAGSCSAQDPPGTVLALAATPGAGSVFTGWSGACSGTGSCRVTLAADRAVTAGFAVARTLTTAASGAGQVGGGGAYAEGTVVAVSETPALGWMFSGWSGDACSGLGPCTVAMGADHTVTATFTPGVPPPRHTLSVALAGGGRGAVAGGGLICPGGCTGAYPTGMIVTLRAAPSAGSSFAGWAGACTGTGSCTVTLGSDLAVRARFLRAAPDTRITAVTVARAARAARFSFNAIGAVVSFACSLRRAGAAPHFTPCSAPRSYSHLARGRWVFAVRAVGPDGPDPTPATRSVRIP
jgi:FG-GAP repeat/Divergent InlB B-repeat domain